MTVLSGEAIREAAPLSPIVDRSVHPGYGMSYGLSHCGYDIRIEFMKRLGEDERRDKYLLLPGEFILGSSVEEFHMPTDLVGVVHDKSSWVRKGLSVFNTVLEPGWSGILTLELKHNGVEPIRLYSGMPIAQVLFHRLDRPVAGYDGKYQNQERKPVEARYENF